MNTSLNDNAEKICQKLLDHAEEYQITNERLPCKATVIDAGLKTLGSISTGIMLARITLGDCVTISTSIQNYDGLELPSLDVTIDNPGIPTLAAQMAGWQLKEEEFFAMGSGPARILAKKPKDIYQALDYSEESNNAVLVLEGDTYPTDTIAQKVAEKCGVSPENVFLVIAPTNSIAGALQIAARSVEIPVLRLYRLGLPPTTITSGWGRGAIAPIHPKSTKMMGRTNDMLLYGGTTVLHIKPPEELNLPKLVSQAVSMASKDYGRPFYQIFKSAKWDFYAIDEGLFSIAELIVNDLNSGTTYHAGKINSQVMKESIDYQE